MPAAISAGSVLAAATALALAPGLEAAALANAPRAAAQRANVELVYGAPVRVILPNKVSWAWTVHNDGPGTARNTVVTHDLGKGHKAGRVPQSCTASGSIVTCRIGTLAPGEAARGTIEAEFAPGNEQRMETSGRVTWDGAGTRTAPTTKTGPAPRKEAAAQPSGTTRVTSPGSHRRPTKTTKSEKSPHSTRLAR